MAVRFLPSPEGRPATPQSERPHIAEVIELRTRFRRADPQGVPAGRATDADAEHPLQSSSHAGGPSGSEDLPGESPHTGLEHSALDAAIRLLARRARSSGELRRELQHQGYPEFDVEEAVDQCVTDLYLDDAGLARAVMQKLRDTKGASRTQIRQKLRDRMLPDGDIEAALAELDEEEETELLRQTAQDRARKMGRLDRATAERRLLGFLARRGWSGEPARAAVRDALDGSPIRPARGSVRFTE